MDALPANRSWQPPSSHGTYQHEAITSRSRQFLMMGTWLPETCWETSRREIKNTKVTSSWFFLSTLKPNVFGPTLTCWLYPPLDERFQNLATPEWTIEVFRRFLSSIYFSLYFTLSHTAMELSLLTPITVPERVSIGPCQVAANASDGRCLWRK